MTAQPKLICGFCGRNMRHAGAKVAHERAHEARDHRPFMFDGREYRCPPDDHEWITDSDGMRRCVHCGHAYQDRRLERVESTDRDLGPNAWYSDDEVDDLTI